MSEELSKSGNEDRSAAEPIVLRKPEGYQIAEVLVGVIEKIGDSRVARSNWWEAYSHGLSMPVHGEPGSDRGLLRRCRDAERYIELETDFLHFDDHGFDREDYGDPTGKPIEIGHEDRLKSLALRVVAFMQTRKELIEKGFVLPENPELAKAVDAINAELSKDARMAAQFAHLLGGQPSSFESRAVDAKSKKGLPDHS